MGLPTPRTVKDVRSFLGATSYYRKFIKGYSVIAHPLIALTKKESILKGGKIEWKSEHEEAFNTLKLALMNPPVLAFFCEKKQTVLRTDASLKGISGELLQLQEDGTLRPVAYVSRKISNTEGRWSVSELELLAIVYSVSHFRSMLYGKYFEVQTDHAALQHLRNIKCATSRLNRLSLKLMDFDFRIVFKTGASIRMANLLSRYPLDKEVDEEPAREEFDINVIKSVNIVQLQMEERELADIRRALLNLEGADSKVARSARLYTLHDDVLYYKHHTPWEAKQLLVLPQVLITEVMKAYHEPPTGAHLGITKTYGKIKEKYFWKNMSVDITNFVRSCLACQKNKSERRKPAGLLQPILPKEIPFSEIVVDYIGPLPNSNKKRYILVALDSTTRYAVVRATEKADSNTTARFLLEDIVPRFGVPAIIRSDNGTHFLADALKQLYGALGVEHRTSTAYHPETQGVTERYNSTLLTMLRFFVNEKHSDWSKYVTMVTFAYNTSVQKTTGFSPFYLLHGFEATQPIDLAILPKKPDHDILRAISIIQEIRGKLPEVFSKAQEGQKGYYDVKRRDLKFDVGEDVMLQVHFQAGKGCRKLSPVYDGPFKVVRVVSPVNYEIERIKNRRWVKDIVHVNRLKKFYCA